VEVVMRGDRTVLGELVAAGLVLTALALPFLHVPGDGTARMWVNFRTTEMAKAKAFSTETSRSVCTVMAAALSYENPTTGEFTRVDCRE
jgi:hypothetical protein